MRDTVYHLRPEQLLHSPFISPLKTQGLYRASRQIFEKHGMMPRILLETVNPDTAASLASEGLGARKSWVITRHFARNVFSPVLVASTNSIASAILTESSLSYLGFGISIPNPSWGGMLEGAQTYILTHPSLSVYPGVCILLTVLCFNVLGNGFRRRFSPNSGR